MKACYQDCKYWDYEEIDHGDDIEPQFRCSHPNNPRRDCILIEKGLDWDEKGECAIFELRNPIKEILG